MEGKIKFFHIAKHYGFVVDETGTDHFFHERDVEGPKMLEAGDVVSFESIKNDKGPQAIKVVLIKRGDDI